MIEVEVSKTIGIGSYDYRVTFKQRMARDTKMLGTLDSDTQVMELEPDTSQQTKTMTFWHETIEGINDVFHCDLTEENIDRIAQGIVSIMRRDLGIELNWSRIGGE